MNIPKKIHLTCKDKNNIGNVIWKKCLEKYKLIYPDYEIIIYDNEDIYNIIQKYHPEYLYKIKQIRTGAILADIFRYLILYLEGGIYSDFDCEPIKRIDKLLDPNFKYYHGDKNRDNNYWIYQTKGELVNTEWDFTHNICDNCQVINNKNNPIHMKCLGHSMGNISTILGYEFHSDFIDSHVTDNNKWCYNKVGICQWFIITEPNQDIFIKMFNNIMNNIDRIIKITKKKITKKKDDEYHYNVINTTGPLAFTKVVMNNLTDKIKILPCDFFCCGSWNSAVPKTRNSYVKHHFTGTWL